MRISGISGAIYGKPFQIQLIDELGYSITFEGSEGLNIHTRLVLVPKGEERDKLAREILIEELRKRNVETPYL